MGPSSPKLTLRPEFSKRPPRKVDISIFLIIIPSPRLCRLFAGTRIIFSLAVTRRISQHLIKCFQRSCITRNSTRANFVPQRKSRKHVQKTRGEGGDRMDDELAEPTEYMAVAEFYDNYASVAGKR